MTQRWLRLAGQVARREGLTVRVRGSCMAPGLADGAGVEVRARRLYWPGDVLVFHDGRGRLLAHRLLGWVPHRRGLAFLTRADSALHPDAPVAPERVLGRAVGAPVPPGQRLRAVLALLRCLLRHARRRLTRRRSPRR